MKEIDEMFFDDRLSNVYETTKNKVKDSSVSHNHNHYLRVYRNCMWLCEELNGDKLVAGAAALTHDFHRTMGEGYTDPSESLSEIRGILEENGFSEEKIKEILHCVEHHEEYTFGGEENPAETLEARILQDADNLDAIGAVGVARVFSFGGENQNKMWEPENLDDEYVKEDTSEASINHMQTKIVNLKQNMNTEPARQKAEERYEFVLQFINKFKSEWEADF